MDNQELQNNVNSENVETAANAAETAQNVAENVTDNASGFGAGTAETASYSYAASYDDGESGEEKKNVLGLVGMILGICSIVFFLCGCCAGLIPFAGKVLVILVIILRIILGAAAIILGIVGIKKCPEKKGFSIAAIVTGAIGLIFGLVNLVLSIVTWIFGAVLNTTVNSGQMEQWINTMLENLE